MIEVLLAAGANVMARNQFRNTPLHDAARAKESMAVIEALLASGADPMARDEKGNTPLHMVADRRAWSYGGSQVVAAIQVLLTAGADPIARNAEGETPWDLVKRNQVLKEPDVYWRLNDARFEAQGGGAHRVPKTSPEPAGNEDLLASERGCQVQGYPNPSGGKTRDAVELVEKLMRCNAVVP